MLAAGLTLPYRLVSTDTFQQTIESQKTEGKQIFYILAFGFFV